MLRPLPVALILGGVLSLAFGSEGHACDCMAAPPPIAALADAESVFSGTVRKISTGLDGYNHVDFDVDSYWKSSGSNRISVTTGANEAGCGYPFRVGTKYLVYANSFPPSDQLLTGLCQRTKPIVEAGVDLTALGSGMPTTQSTGSGLNSNYLLGAGALVLFAGSLLLRARRRRRLIRT